MNYLKFNQKTWLFMNSIIKQASISGIISLKWFIFVNIYSYFFNTLLKGIPFIIIMNIENKISNALRSTIVYLNLADLEDDHLYQIAESNTNNIIELWMEYGGDHEANNKITFVGIYELSLSSWNSLLRLGLWNNKVGSIGCKFIARMECPSLQYLNLNKNQIDAGGIFHLSKLNAPSLISIDLSNNKLGLFSVRLFTKGNWKKLKDVFMTDNKFRKEDFIDFFLLDIPYGSKIWAEAVEKSWMTWTMKGIYERKFGFDNFS